MTKLIKHDISYPEHLLQVKLPVNCTPDDEKYFADTLLGTVRACRVWEPENYFANRELVLWKNGTMMPEAFAHTWIIDKVYGSFKSKLKFRIKNFLRKTKVIEEPVVWCIDQYATGGYYHWIIEILPRLWMVKDYLPEMQFALPDYFLERWPFVQQFLDLLGIKKLLVLDNKHKYLIRHMVMPTRPGDPFYRQHIPLVNGVQWLKQEALKKAHLFLGKRIYISRQKARYRKVVNEEDILPVLHKYGFNVINLEDYNLPDQISLLSKAEIVMSIHGAGLGNMVFMPPGSKLVEIRPAKVYHIYNCFHTLWPHCVCDYYYLLCDYAPKPLEHDGRIDDHSVIIDATKLEKFLTEFAP
jgi:hypothetical protein